MLVSSRPYLISSTLALAMVTLLAGCSGTYKKWSDREVFGILKNKSKQVPNADDALLNITPPTAIQLEKLAKNLKTEEFLGDRAKVEANAHVITLADALGMAVNHNRAYLGEKENVYLTALDLTGVRHEFALIPSASGQVENHYQNVERSVNATEGGVPVTVNKWVTEHSLSATGGVGFSALTRIGTRIATDLTTDVFEFISGHHPGLSSSKFAASISQPLLRGAGSLSVGEPLRQSERDVLYNVRTFTQYRKTFAIDTATQYFSALQSRSEARNAYIVYQSFKNMLTAQAALVDANKPGRTKSALGLLQQAELTYQRRWITSVQGYEEDLDALKLHLGIPVNEPIILAQQDLDKLELIDPQGTLDEALQAALAARLDLWNVRDARDDAIRHVKIAERDLLPGIGVKGNYTITGDPGADGLNLDSKRHNYSVGLDLDLHLDQKPARNALREAQVLQQRAERTLELAEENIRKQVRASWRNLEVARKQYAIAQDALKLSEGRLELETALYQADRGNSRDLIDAQTALITARDQITSSLIAHTIARIQLYRDIGVLFIRKDGSWADVLKHEQPFPTKP